MTDPALHDAVHRIREADAALIARSPTPFPLPLGGLDAVVAGTVTALQRGDWWVPGLRERVGAVLRDAPLDRLVDGRQGARPYRVAPPDISPALRALYAVGLAIASDGVAAVHLGIGSAADGAFHEALNLASLQDAPVLFIVAVQPLSDEAPLTRQLAATPAGLATAFSIASTVIDGSDVVAVHQAVRAARESGRPHLIEARLG